MKNEEAMKIRVKICGITRVEDAVHAEKNGADAIGVVACSDSPRSVPLERVAEIFDALGPFVTTVIVTHTTSESELAALLDLDPGAVQLSHPFTRFPGYKGKIIRVIGKGEELPGDCDALAVDESRGKGLCYDPVFAKKIVDEAAVPVMLCGGLTPGNVTEAIRRVHPYAVDVCSGVERRPGVKEPRLVRAFLENAGRFAPVPDDDRTGED
jgi:phosphoribosylanthranilate isomerase